jgi:hypothetical protein
MPPILFAKLKKNSVPTTIAAPGITDTDATIPVTELSRFYDEDGVLITRGIVIGGNSANAILTITGASGTSGAGNLTGAVRGYKADGTIGAARAWDSGTNVGVTFSTGVYNNLISTSATRTTATRAVYVDAAAAGNADGTTWTDAFTSITDALAALPTILEHAVTIYVRKGASAYAGAVAINKVIGRGSLVIRGEYYWTGNCAAAAVPATTKFNTAAHTNGANIAVGDYVLVTSGYGGAGAYTYFDYTTVKGVVDKGSNIYEIELDAAADWGNISATDYYTIVKTSCSATFGISAGSNVTITGIHINTASAFGISLTQKSIAAMNCVFSTGATAGLYATSESIVSSASNCYFYAPTYGVYVLTNSAATMGTYGSASHACVFRGTIPVYQNYQSTTVIRYSLISISVENGTGVYADRGSFSYVDHCTVAKEGAIAGTTGFKAANSASVIVGSCNNTQAATAKTPAAASDPAYVT